MPKSADATSESSISLPNEYNIRLIRKRMSKVCRCHRGNIPTSEFMPLNGSRAVLFILCATLLRYTSAVAFDHAQRINGAAARADLNVHMRRVLVLAGDLRDRADRVARAKLLSLLHRQL